MIMFMVLDYSLHCGLYMDSDSCMLGLKLTSFHGFEYSKSSQIGTNQYKNLEAIFPKLCTLQLRTMFQFDET